MGDGHSETVIGDPRTSSEEVARVRPHGLRASAAWLESACRGCEPRWISAATGEGIEGLVQLLAREVGKK